MQANAAEQRENNSSKKIIFMTCVYVFLILSTRYVPTDLGIQTAFIKGKLTQPDDSLTLHDALNVFTFQQIYEGTWKKEGNSQYLLSQQKGKVIMYLDRSIVSSSSYAYRAEFQIINGEYIDKGTLFFDIYLNQTSFAFQRVSNTEAVVYFNSSDGSDLKARFRQDNILLTVNEGSINVTGFNFTFYQTLEEKIEVSLTIQSEGSTLTFSSFCPQNKGTTTMVFAAVILFCSIMSFSAMMRIIKDIMELRDNPRRYSFVTILISNMWDTVLCILCFLFAFRDQESLMLFIIPAFLLCLLFTNLQPRLLIYIFQDWSDNDLNLRQQLCRFNIFHYGSILSIYPILLLTNFNFVLFIGMSCIFFPQIYTNAFVNVRPDVTSHYYVKYLLSRFLIVLYLRCNPYNIFSLQPNYVLTGICFMLVSIQLGLVYIQSLYGSKKVLPSFLLEPVFDYKLEEEFNIEEGTEVAECSICLGPLHVDPPSQDQLDFVPNFKLMKTPCNHHYHSHCLMVWMRIKMECPQCRYKLPPYE